MDWEPQIRNLNIMGMAMRNLGPACSSYKPLEPTAVDRRQGEPRQPNKAYSGLLGAIGACWHLLGRRGSSHL